MKVLSVRQPWASLIASGAKTLEVRSWPTNYRGPLLIVAGGRPWRGPDGQRAPYACGPLGVTICIVDLVDCRRARPGDEAGPLVAPGPDDYVWELSNPRPVAPVAHKGQLNIYEASAELRAALGISA